MKAKNESGDFSNSKTEGISKYSTFLNRVLLLSILDRSNEILQNSAFSDNVDVTWHPVTTTSNVLGLPYMPN